MIPTIDPDRLCRRIRRAERVNDFDTAGLDI